MDIFRVGHNSVSCVTEVTRLVFSAHQMQRELKILAVQSEIFPSPLYIFSYVFYLFYMYAFSTYQCALRLKICSKDTISGLNFFFVVLLYRTSFIIGSCSY